LRGLALNAHCPECGLPVSVSVGSGHLRLSSRAYVATLHSALVFLLYGAAFGLGYHLARLLGGFRNAWILALTQIPGLIGLWLVATPDPRGLETKTTDFLRKFLRFSVMVSVVDVATILIPYSLWRQLPLAMWGWLGIVLLLLDYAGSVALMLYISTLAERIPSEKLARFATQLACLIGALAIVSVTAHSIWQNVCIQMDFEAVVDPHFRRHPMGGGPDQPGFDPALPQRCSAHARTTSEYRWIRRP